MAALSAWLFDVYPDADGMRLWLLDDGGRMHTLHDTFTPCLYARGPLDDLRAVARMLRARRAPVTLRRAERRDLFLDREVEVLEIGVRLPALLPTVLRWAAEFRPYLTYYDADIPLPQRYVLARGVFPLAACDVEYDPAASRLRAIATVDSPWEVDYRLPPFRVMTLRLSQDQRDDEAGQLYNPARRPAVSHQPSATLALAPERSAGRLTAPVHRNGCAPTGRGSRPGRGARVGRQLSPVGWCPDRRGLPMARRVCSLSRRERVRVRASSSWTFTPTPTLPLKGGGRVPSPRRRRCLSRADDATRRCRPRKGRSQRSR